MRLHFPGSKAAPQLTWRPRTASPTTFTQAAAKRRVPRHRSKGAGSPGPGLATARLWIVSCTVDPRATQQLAGYAVSLSDNSHSDSVHAGPAFPWARPVK